MNVLDCILSLNRKYDSFVVPRVEDFLERHPEVESLEDLAVMINKHGVTEFLLRKLNYNDPSRARTLFGVVEWLIELQHKYEGETENDRLEAWAVQSKAEEFEKVYRLSGGNPLSIRVLAADALEGLDARFNAEERALLRVLKLRQESD